MKVEQITLEIALATVAKLRFHPFDQYDWKDFPRCKSQNPMIAMTNDLSDDLHWVIDGDTIMVYDTDSGEEMNFAIMNPLTFALNRHSSVVNAFQDVLRNAMEDGRINLHHALAVAALYDAGLIWMKEYPEEFANKYGTVAVRALAE